MSLETACLITGMMKENCYILSDRELAPGDCVLVDPGDDAGKISYYLKEQGLRPLAILLTHGHFDHITAVPELLETYKGVKVYACKDEIDMLGDAGINLSEHFLRPVELTDAEPLSDGERIRLLGHDFKVIATPGHTAGSCCYYEEKEKLLYSGDTLFRSSYGRTDLPTGSEEEMGKSLNEKLFTLPEDVKVYPGHDAPTSIGFERKHNPGAI